VERYHQQFGRILLIAREPIQSVVSAYEHCNSVTTSVALAIALAVLSSLAHDHNLALDA